MSKKLKKVVCIGGGSGIPKLILEPLKDLNLNLTAINSMVDSGGSAGAIRNEFNVSSAGDIRRHFLALSCAEGWRKKLWELRFAKHIEISPLHGGHNFANVFIGGLEYLLCDYEKVLDICHEFLKIKGTVLPATIDKVELVAELEDGSLAKSEAEIDLGRNHNRNLKVKRVYLNPGGKVYTKAAKAIEAADYILIGPGDMYSSLIPCFLSDGMREAMQKSKAKKIFICPAMTKLGETQGYSVKDFADKVEEYIGASLDYVIYNNNISDKKRIAEFKEEMKEEFVFDPPKFDKSLNKKKFIGRNLLLKSGEMKYDKAILIPFLRKVIGV